MSQEAEAISYKREIYSIMDENASLTSVDSHPQLIRFTGTLGRLRPRSSEHRRPRAFRAMLRHQTQSTECGRLTSDEYVLSETSHILCPSQLVAGCPTPTLLKLH